MGKTLTFIIGALVGIIFGGLLTYYLFIGTPQAPVKPGQPIKIPDAKGTPAGTAQIVLKEEFFNSILQTIFQDMSEPTFPLQLASDQFDVDKKATRFGLLQNGQCDGKIKLLKQGSDVQTGVQFENNQIKAPLAFSGNANVFGNCIEFKGWSKANLELRYDDQKKNVYGIVNVETVNLDGISPVFSAVITPLVQNTLNQNVNPIQIINGQQISVNLPITATDGTLQANISDVRAEVKDKALSLFVSYDFAGSKMETPGK